MIIASTLSLYLYRKITREYNDISLEDFVRSIQPAMTIAALRGPLATVKRVVTNPNHIIPSDFIMPLFDREKMRLVLLEYNRLQPCVSQSTVLLGKDEKLPPQICPFAVPNNTPISINFVLHGRDPSRWTDPEKFDPYERNLWGKTSEYTMFNGVGDEGPRICPGRDLALEVSITAVKSLLQTGLKHPIVRSDVKRLFFNMVGSSGHLQKKYRERVTENALAWTKLSFEKYEKAAKTKVEDVMSTKVKDVSSKNPYSKFQMAGFTFFSHDGQFLVFVLLIIRLNSMIHSSLLFRYEECHKRRYSSRRIAHTQCNEVGRVGGDIRLCERRCGPYESRV